MIITLHRGRPSIPSACSKVAMYLFDRARPDVAASERYGEVFYQMRDLASLVRDLYKEADATGRDIDIRVDFIHGTPRVQRA